MSMLTQFWDADAWSPLCPWFARVAGFSNPADEPSRGAEALTLFEGTPNEPPPKECAIPFGWEAQLVDILCKEKASVVF